MEDQNSNKQWWWYVVLISIFLVLSSRFLIELRFLLLPILAIAAVGTGVYWLWKYIRNNHYKKAYRTSVPGMIESRIEQCRRQISYNQTQIEDIQKSISELETKLDHAHDLSPQIIKDTKALINDFQQELKLRESKLAFFETCRQKLGQMLRYHELSRELEMKKAKLKSLQENNYDDLAQMEEMKANVEMDVFQLDTIESLSRRIEASSSYNDAERLRAELNEMTKSLGEL